MTDFVIGSEPYIRLATSHFNRSWGISPSSARIWRAIRSRAHFNMAEHRAIRSAGVNESMRELYCCSTNDDIRLFAQ